MKVMSQFHFVTSGIRGHRRPRPTSRHAVASELEQLASNDDMVESAYEITKIGNLVSVVSTLSGRSNAQLESESESAE